MEKLSAKSLERLYAAGWSEDRRIDTTPYKEFSRRYGRELSEIATEFFASFGGLSILYDDRGLQDDVLRLDILNHPDTWPHPEDFEELEEALGGTLYYAGYADESFMHLFMNEKGTIYLNFQGRIDLAGEDYLEAIDAILCDKPMRVIFND